MRYARCSVLKFLIGVIALGVASCASRDVRTPGKSVPSESYQAERQTGAPSAADSRFGVMTHFAQGWNTALIEPVTHASVANVRDELYWSAVEPKKGEFVFPEFYEDYMRKLSAAGISPLIVLSFENPNYDGGMTPYTEEGRAGYARYATKVVQHFGAQIKAVEIWNEYNGSFCKGPAEKNRTTEYTRMLKTAYAEIKRESPQVQVLGGSTAGVPLPYWKRLFAEGALDSMDALSIHPYRYESAPEGIERTVDALREQILKANHGIAKPIWVTEIGWNNKTVPKTGFAIDEMMQARFLVRAYALLLSAGVDRIYWYSLKDYNELQMGLLHDDAANTPKPAYAALTTLLKEIGNARFVRREPSRNDFYSIIFQRPDGREVRIVWSLTPTTVELSGAQRVVGMLGGSPIDRAHFKLSEDPLYVEGAISGIPEPSEDERSPWSGSSEDFSSEQGQNGWSYGFYSPNHNSWEPLPSFAATDWKEEWVGDFPYISVSAEEQHPSISNGKAVPSVRRWKSQVQGSVHFVGEFKCGPEGDGVGVSVVIDGNPIFRELIGGNRSPVKKFDFVQTVEAGTTVDFAVDPGPETNIDYDSTQVSVKIYQHINHG